MFNAKIGSDCPFYYLDGYTRDKEIFKIEWVSEVEAAFNIVVRALLTDRVDESIDFKIMYNEITHNDNYSDPTKELRQRLSAFESSSENLWLIAVRRTDSAYFDKLAEGVKEISGWTETAKVRKFFNRTDVTCFTNAEDKKTIVIYRPLDGMSLETERYVLMGVPVYLPWFFKEKPITKEETDFLEALSKTSCDSFIKGAKNLFDIKKIRERIMVHDLDGIGTRFARNKIEYIKNEIESYRRKIETKRNEISNLMVQIQEQNLSLDGLRNIVKNDNNEILEFFKLNDNLVFRDCSGDIMTFYCTGYLDSFDEDAAEEYIDNRDSIIYEYTNINCNDTEKLFRAIFIDQTVKIRTVAMYQVNVSGFRVNGCSDAHYINEVANRFPNTHIHHYHCLGDYEMMMVDALREGNVVGCLSICGMSARSLNFGDSTVMERFVNDITSITKNMNAFEMNGELYNLSKIIEELNK